MEVLIIRDYSFHSNFFDNNIISNIQGASEIFHFVSAWLTGKKIRKNKVQIGNNIL